ncbi:hypothetical protein WOLCODRAFT_81142, partial [Wolfiporia cocos MD-104 SS10]
LFHDTTPNSFGMFRQYSVEPKYIPPNTNCLGDLCDMPILQSNPIHNNSSQPSHSAHAVSYDNPCWPFPNSSIYWFMNWEQHNLNRVGCSGSHLSVPVKIITLLNNVLFAPDFNLSNLEGLNVTHELACVDAAADKQIDHFPAMEGWMNNMVTIPLPKEGVQICDKWAKENDTPVLDVPNIWHHNLLQIIKSVCHSQEAMYHHCVPFQQYWRCPEVYNDNTSKDESPEKTEDIRIYSELYNLDTLLNEYKKLHAQPYNPDYPPDTEVSIVPIMLWLDSTHLMNFGNAFLTQAQSQATAQRNRTHTKYMHGKPTTSASHHLMYMPLVSLI